MLYRGLATKFKQDLQATRAGKFESTNQKRTDARRQRYSSY